MPVKALAGTVAAHQRCVTCGHARIRHVAHGTGRCTTVVTSKTMPITGEVQIVLKPCDCTRFTEGD